MIARISTWTKRKLSYIGRIQLVQLVLVGIQSYWSQLFVLPAKAIKLIDGYCWSYLWSATNTITKKALVDWYRVCSPIYFEGLNLVNIYFWNSGVIDKTYWALSNKEDRLWIKWIHAYYIKNQQINTMSITQQACWMVRKIIEARKAIAQLQLIQSGIQKLIK